MKKARRSSSNRLRNLARLRGIAIVVVFGVVMACVCTAVAVWRAPEAVPAPDTPTPTSQVVNTATEAGTEAVNTPVSNPVGRATEIVQPTATAMSTETPEPTQIPASTPTVEPTSVSTYDDGGWASAGYLWALESPESPLAVIGPEHPSSPATAEQLGRWVIVGEACLVEAGDPYAVDGSVSAPFGAYGIEVMGGGCNGFRGWVSFEFMHANPPP